MQMQLWIFFGLELVSLALVGLIVFWLIDRREKQRGQKKHDPLPLPPGTATIDMDEIINLKRMAENDKLFDPSFKSSKEFADAVVAARQRQTPQPPVGVILQVAQPQSQGIWDLGQGFQRHGPFIYFIDNGTHLMVAGTDLHDAVMTWMGRGTRSNTLTCFAMCYRDGTEKNKDKLFCTWNAREGYWTKWKPARGTRYGPRSAQKHPESLSTGTRGESSPDSDISQRDTDRPSVPPQYNQEIQGIGPES